MVAVVVGIAIAVVAVSIVAVIFSQQQQFITVCFAVDNTSNRSSTSVCLCPMLL